MAGAAPTASTSCECFPARREGRRSRGSGSGSCSSSGSTRTAPRRRRRDAHLPPVDRAEKAEGGDGPPARAAAAELLGMHGDVDPAHATLYAACPASPTLTLPTLWLRCVLRSSPLVR